MASPASLNNGLPADLSVDHWVDMCMKLYVLLLQHVLVSHPQGWLEMARTLSLERYTGHRGGSSASPQHLPLIALSSQLLVELNAHLKQDGSNFTPQQQANLQSTAFLLSAFLLGSPAWSVVALSIPGLDFRPPPPSQPPAPPPSPAEAHNCLAADDAKHAPHFVFAAVPSASPSAADSSSGSSGVPWGRVARRRLGEGRPIKKGSVWTDQCDGSGRAVLYRFPPSSAVFGRRVAERSGTVLVATQLLTLLDTLLLLKAEAAPASPMGLRMKQQAFNSAPAAADPDGSLNASRETPEVGRLHDTPPYIRSTEGAVYGACPQHSLLPAPIRSWRSCGRRARWARPARWRA